MNTSPGGILAALLDRLTIVAGAAEAVAASAVITQGATSQLEQGLHRLLGLGRCPGHFERKAQQKPGQVHRNSCVQLRLHLRCA